MTHNLKIGTIHKQFLQSNVKTEMARTSTNAKNCDMKGKKIVTTAFQSG